MTAIRSLPWTEKDLERFVVDAARQFGWLRYHTHRSEKSAAGWPDEALVRGHQLILAELKSEKARPSPAQQEWLDALQQVTEVTVRLWRPSDCDQIEDLLSGGRVAHVKPGPPHTREARNGTDKREVSLNANRHATARTGNTGGQP